MRFMTSASTDKGTRKSVNQDSLSVQSFQTPRGKVVFGVLCDGMGGLAKGEMASAAVVRAFRDWAAERLPILCRSLMVESELFAEWEKMICEKNRQIQAFARQKQLQKGMGTTIVMALLTETRYYIMNVGDSRAYEISTELHQLTTDHTLVMHEVAQGMLTVEEAEHDSRQNILTQCCGATDHICPQMLSGEVHTDCVYMLCSDGFRHKVTQDELYRWLEPAQLSSEQLMKNHTETLIDCCRKRRETDDISVILIRSYEGG